MTDKKKKIKTVVLILISMIFIFMLYNTFFKAKKPSGRTAKSRPQKIINTLPENTLSQQQERTVIQIAGSSNAKILETRVGPFEYIITNIFEPSNAIKPAPKKKPQKLKIISDAIKKIIKPEKPPAMSEEEKASFLQALEFKGSILSSTSSVAIINSKFIHPGDSINGYKVISISEKQVNIDTGRGMITLEIMKHE